MSRLDAAHCRRIVRSHARTFWLASHFLPSEKRRAAFALYAFCRVADDMVDLAAGKRAAEVPGLLTVYRQQLHDALAGAPPGPVWRELALAVRRYGVPDATMHELLDGVASDCAPVRYGTWRELASYCERVASSVGEMCMHVFGVDGDDAARVRARRYARTLGVAMQLTNILRDVGEDAARGRCYLPDDELAQFGLSRGDVLARRLGGDERWRALMAFQIGRARSLYESALPGIALLAPDARRCAAACALGYAGILGAIEKIHYDTFRERARLGTIARGGVLLGALRASTRVAPTHSRRTASRLADVLAEPELPRWA
jgi:phytoene synthase